MSTTLCFDQDQCVGCAICVDVCPSEALEMESTDLLPRLITERCTSCAKCVQECPTGAIDLSVSETSIQS